MNCQKMDHFPMPSPPPLPRRIELPYRSNVNYEVNLCLCGAEMKDAVLVALTHRQLLWNNSSLHISSIHNSCLCLTIGQILIYAYILNSQALIRLIWRSEA